MSKVLQDWHNDGRQQANYGLTLHQMAIAANVPLPHLVKHHTLIPLLRVFVPDKEISTAAAHAVLNYFLLRKELYFCADCVSADQDAFGRSYWRRDHQVPGMYWCQKHRLPLRFVTAWKEAVSEAPSRHLENSCALSYDSVAPWWGHQLIRRYIDVCHVLMDASRAFPISAIRATLRMRAKPLGYCNDSTTRSARELVPAGSTAESRM